MASDFFGMGWPFPVRPTLSGALALLGGEAKVRQSIVLILSTALGERPMLPDFGCGIHDLVHMPNTAALRGLVAQRVRDALTRWESRIDVADVRVETAPNARNLLTIRIDYRLRSNNAIFNLVYPFFLSEGAA
ncbi:MAG TPA: GPW/gp25 family protein [Gemmataceae bacterium]|jgi:hypothetical protein